MPEEVTFEALNEYVADKGGQTITGYRTWSRHRRYARQHRRSVLVNIGDRVEAGQPVLVTEAMKMETEIHANIGGSSVSEVHVAKGDRVTPGEILMVIE